MIRKIKSFFYRKTLSMLLKDKDVYGLTGKQKSQIEQIIRKVEVRNGKQN